MRAVIDAAAKTLSVKQLQPDCLPRGYSVDDFINTIFLFLVLDVRQKDLETVIPKSKGAYVMVIGGKYQGQVSNLFCVHILKSD